MVHWRAGGESEALVRWKWCRVENIWLKIRLGGA